MPKVSKKLMANAYHEAGHAVADHVQGGATKRLTIVPEGATDGACTHYPLRETASFLWDTDSCRNRRRLERRIISALGGGAAEARYRGRYNRVGASSDWERARKFANQMVGSAEEAGAYLHWLEVRTRGLFEVDWWWDITTHLANELVAKKTMSAKEVRAALRWHPELPSVESLRHDRQATEPDAVAGPEG